VMLHGALRTGAQAESTYGWDDEANAAGFVVAFITALVRHVSAQLSIDPGRIYATGISNRGMLVYRLACDTTIFAAIGPDSATELNACPSPALIDSWRHVDHCAAPRTDTSGAITTSTAICPDHRAVVLVAIAGAGHQWPGGTAPSGVMAGLLDPPYPGFDATDAIWHFFAGHPKRR